ncbi:putative ATP-dependent RNA helicase DDX28-like isoform X2 [Dinothrombium tinctorium]|uniref:RNA helicase n=1 Tax=Dinothrombium tinctorium TaxID=1965070 RepID=A0A443RFG1_9ACAR|nr:putative ATP-dependent RNA helicase DDX28-like isoform X2 [Dinothrombium tinctorium]RWS17748.1 putative ATP-dependent RNA helicase DDX28-like isoform X2 [Dinothrombium tinctorium]
MKALKSAIAPISRRYFASFEVPNQLPVITVPKYLEANIKHLKARLKREEQQFLERVARAGNRNVLLISSKNNPKLNHYLGQTYRKDTQISLASISWKKRKTIGDKITFHAFSPNPFNDLYSDDGGVTFASLGLSDQIVEALDALNYKKPSNIQKQAIPIILSKQGVICSAETGCGKTLAYLTPIIENVRRMKLSNRELLNKRAPYAIIVVPSRELALQVADVARPLAACSSVGVAVTIGGKPQDCTFNLNYDILISTAGIITQHVNKGFLSLRNVKTLVLDEADTLLDDSFTYSVWDLLQTLKFKNKDCNFGCQLVLVSATFPSNLKEALDNYIDVQSLEKISTEKLHCIMSHVKQVFLRLDKKDRQMKIIRMAQENEQAKKATIIFTNRTPMCNFLYYYLNEHQIPCLRLNKKVPEDERIENFKKFQSGETNILVATDLGSRGLDTTRVSHIINYECPHYTSDYIHRAGRTGRTGSPNSCVVTSFVCFKPDAALLNQLEYAIRKQTSINVLDSNIKRIVKEKWRQKLQKLNAIGNEIHIAT